HAPGRGLLWSLRDRADRGGFRAWHAEPASSPFHFVPPPLELLCFLPAPGGSSTVPAQQPPDGARRKSLAVFPAGRRDLRRFALAQPRLGSRDLCRRGRHGVAFCPATQHYPLGRRTSHPRLARLVGVSRFVAPRPARGSRLLRFVVSGVGREPSCRRLFRAQVSGDITSRVLG